MTTDFRAELERLVKAYDDHGGRWPDDDVRALYQAVQKARAALSAPEQGATDEELISAYQSAYEPAWKRGEYSGCHVDGLRAVLARWGRPAAEPVPVSERPILKSDPFNNADGHCWCGLSDFIDDTGDHPVSFPASWELREPCPQDDCVLPHWALPVPQEGADG